MSRKTFYIYSSLSIFFQFYFLILAKDFTDDFFIYIQLISISSLLNGVFGSIQFFFQNKRTISIRKEILIFYLCLKILIFIFCSIKYDFLIGFVFIILSLSHAKTVLVFDDIHWSKGMEDAWKMIQNHPKVYLSIDLFYCGLIFFQSDHNQKTALKLISSQYKPLKLF